MRWPFICWSEHVKVVSALDRVIKNLRYEHKQEIERTQKTTAQIVERLSHINFEPGPVYQLHLLMSPPLVAGGQREELQLMAKLLAREVEIRVSSATFVDPLPCNSCPLGKW